NWLPTVKLSVFFFSSRRRHTRWPRDWSSDVCSSDLSGVGVYTLNAGTILGNNENVGADQGGVGTFNQTGGYQSQFSLALGMTNEIGRASCRERVQIWVEPVSG